MFKDKNFFLLLPFLFVTHFFSFALYGDYVNHFDYGHLQKKITTIETPLDAASLIIKQLRLLTYCIPHYSITLHRKYLSPTKSKQSDLYESLGALSELLMGDETLSDCQDSWEKLYNINIMCAVYLSKFNLRDYKTSDTLSLKELIISDLRNNFATFNELFTMNPYSHFSLDTTSKALIERVKNDFIKDNFLTQNSHFKEICKSIGKRLRLPSCIKISTLPHKEYANTLFFDVEQENNTIRAMTTTEQFQHIITNHIKKALYIIERIDFRRVYATNDDTTIAASVKLPEIPTKNSDLQKTLLMNYIASLLYLREKTTLTTQYYSLEALALTQTLLQDCGFLIPLEDHKKIHETLKTFHGQDFLKNSPAKEFSSEITQVIQKSLIVNNNALYETCKLTHPHHLCNSKRVNLDSLYNTLLRKKESRKFLEIPDTIVLT